MKIRAESPEDYDAIAKVIGAAFETEDEVRLVDAVRISDGYLPELALVAEQDSMIVGHIVFSYVGLQGAEAMRVLALAPMAVAPTQQRTGIGSALVQSGLKEAEAMSEPLVLVLGHAHYYPRFGFEPARSYGIEPPWPDLPNDVWMVKLLSSYSQRFQGTVRYPPAFDTP